MFITKEDIIQIQERGSNPDVIEKQLKRFKEGFPYTEIVEPASTEKGISIIEDNEKRDLAAYFDLQKEDVDICRFVPASGAATRMFKDLYNLRDNLIGKSKLKQIDFISESEIGSKFFSVIEQYPFYRELNLVGDEPPHRVIDILLGDKGLGYGALPKGLISFHNYGEISRTAFEEHLHEAVRIAGNKKPVSVHFTVSEEHLDGFKMIQKAVEPAMENAYQVKFDISYSFQKKSTDTIAVDPDNSPIRDQEGKLVFRPAGHGALIENLNELDSDVIFINNIDNVSPDSNSENRTFSKKILGGLLLKLRAESGFLMQNLITDDNKTGLDEALKWLREVANIQIPEFDEKSSGTDLKNMALKMLDRPIRVCGMVRNQGEPGGGPFFTRNADGVVSLQIVEKSQINPDNKEQMALLMQSSHFNPVDLVCSIRGANGKVYHLTDYVDWNTGFISEKSVQGEALKALELPGLWNGSMADWITVFVEIPSETFTPVKTVFDLVRPEHLKA